MPSTVLNHDLVGLLDRLVRFKEELLKSNSSGSSELNPFDLARVRSYLAALTSYLDWVVGQPQLDLPESSPKEYAVDDAPPAQEVESEIVSDLGRLLDAAYDEMLNSQSSRKAAGLIGFDQARIRALISKCTSYLSSVEAMAPLDLPESSPGTPVSGLGKKGV